MPRYKLIIEYDGSPFCGWQFQAGRLSVQEVLERAMAKLEGEAVTVHGSGRTDAGVHALGQCAHADLGKAWSGFELMNAVNHLVRQHPVAVLSAEEVPADFHARFSAVKRRYLYRVVNRRAPLTLEQHQAWHVPSPLDADAMHLAAQGLLGKHDFTTFRSANCQAQSPVKTLDRFDVMRHADQIDIHCEARSFLQHQVRSMVGSLKQVGLGKWHPRDLRRALDARSRAACGPVAPPDGLYLVEVSYPAESAGVSTAREA